MTVLKLTKRIALVGILLLAVEATSAVCSGQPSLPGGPTVSVVVTVTGSGTQDPGMADKANVLVYQNHQRRPVTNWVRATDKTAPLELALLVDESLGPEFNTLLPDLRQFIRGLPASARIAVVYSTNSNANFVQEFTTNHEKAARALRLPLGAAAGNLSIYFAAQDLMKRWPDQSGSWRRAVLVVSDGIDTYHGAADSSPGNNADLSAAVRALSRRGAIAYTLYASGSSSASRNPFLVNNGQSCLSLLAHETGGAAFFQGLKTPVSFRPFLGRLDKLFSSQYVLGFKSIPRAKAGLEPISVTSELPDVHINAPKEVWTPGR